MKFFIFYEKYARKRGAGFMEYIVLMASMISLVALSLDIMIPALPEIGKDFQLKHPNDAQLVVSVLILGLAIGQLAYGPLSDSTGRKPAIFTGVLIFAVGCMFSIFATRFWLMLLGRLLQGLGAAGPRSVIVALVRDQYEGRGMAKIMSAVMAVFILVPAVAPALGQAILIIGNWRTIFSALMGLSILTLSWFMVRQPETLTPEFRIPFSPELILKGIVETCTNRIALGYTVAAGLVMGAFLGYLNSAQQLFQEVYRLGRQFPIYMAVLALSIGGASLVNSRIVMRWGMRTLSRWAVRLLIIFSSLYFFLAYWMGGYTPLWLMMISFALTFFCIGILFGNLNAIAMKPLGHIAGIGAAVVGSLSAFLAVPLAILIGRSFNGTVLPITLGFFVLSILSAFSMWWADQS